MISLDTTVAKVLQLRDQIQRHGALLRQSEAETKNVLVTPLLGVLGWRIGQLDEVRTEYRTVTGVGVADYALMSFETKRPEYLIEAKGLQTDLKEALPQAMQYSYESGVEKSVLTNGDEWLVVRFQTGTQNPMDVLERFSIMSEDAVITALKAETLRNPITRNDIAKSIAQVHTISRNLSAIVNCDEVAAYNTRNSSDDDRWIPLETIADLNYDDPPLQIRFYDGFSMPVGRWKDLVRWVGLWLAHHHDFLAEDDCNIKADRARTRFVAHKSRGRLVEPLAVGNNVFVEFDLNRSSAITNSCKLLEYCASEGSATVRFQ